MTRPCLGHCGRLITTGRRCPQCQRAWDQRRNARPARRIYDGAWARHSKQRREQEGACQRCGSTRDLTVDHPTDAVLCRSHHNQLEEHRKRTRGVIETGRVAVGVPAPVGNYPPDRLGVAQCWTVTG